MVATAQSVETTCPPPSTGRQLREHRMMLPDGTSLFYRHWTPHGPACRSVILLHRGHEHSGRMDALAGRLVDEGAEVFAWDARGHGNSTGERGWAPSFAQLVRDLDVFVRHVREAHGVRWERLVVLGNSVGSVVAATWAHDHAPPIAGLVLGTPAFRVKLYVPWALCFLRMLVALLPRTFVRSYVNANLLTHDAGEAALYDRDPLITRRIAAGVLVGMFDTARRVVADAAAIQVPVLLLTAGKDWVVHQEPQREFFRNLSSAHKRLKAYPGFFHDIFHERDSHLPVAEACAFIREVTSQPVSVGTLPVATPDAPTALGTPLPPWSPRRWMWTLYRLTLSTVGRLSTGIRVGFAQGFDSGASLDHVYQDKAQGFSPLGRMVDRIYLDAPGWRGIRTRRGHVEEMLAECVDQCRATLGPVVRVMDVACGHGRYLAPVAARAGTRLLLRDFDPANLERAVALVKAGGGALVEVQQADAFDPESYRNAGRVDVAVVSGLFELFPDNGRVLRALQGIRSAMPLGGRLVFTNQPWHPQLEMIARVLPNREGKPWVMRCRSQAEMDALITAAGFRKTAQRADDHAIFTVCSAQAV